MRLWVFLRIEKGYSQEELARRIGVSRPYITMLEAGTKNMSAKMLERISFALEWKGEADRLAADLQLKPSGSGGRPCQGKRK